MQIERESQVYESTLQKMNGQLESSLAVMAGEKAALQLSLTALQTQFEGVAQAVYSADDSVVGAPAQSLQSVCCAMSRCCFVNEVYMLQVSRDHVTQPWHMIHVM